jgi:hypothetical protein
MIWLLQSLFLFLVETVFPGEEGGSPAPRTSSFETPLKAFFRHKLRRWANFAFAGLVVNGLFDAGAGT